MHGPSLGGLKVGAVDRYMHRMYAFAAVAALQCLKTG